MTKFWTEVDVPFVLEKHVLPQGPWARCCLIKDKSKGGGEMVCICLSILSHLSIWRLCSCACEARIWNNCSIIWDSSCGSVPPLLPGLPVTTDVYFMKVMDGFWGCNFFFKCLFQHYYKAIQCLPPPYPNPHPWLLNCHWYYPDVEKQFAWLFLSCWEQRKDPAWHGAAVQMSDARGSCVIPDSVFELKGLQCSHQL